MENTDIKNNWTIFMIIFIVIICGGLLFLAATIMISTSSTEDNLAPQTMIDFYDSNTDRFQHLVEYVELWNCTGICQQSFPADVIEWAGDGTLVVCKHSGNTIERFTAYMPAGDFTYIPHKTEFPRGTSACSYALQCSAKIADNWFICASSNQ